MTALRDQWQAQRQHRQAEVVQRRQAVFAKLNDFQQARTQSATQLRQDLQQFYAALQAETELYLAQIHQQHQARARQTRTELVEFHAELQDAVADLRQRMQDQLATLAAETQQTLTGYGHDRAVARIYDQQQRAAEVADRRAVIADQLAHLQTARQQAAAVARQQRQRDRAALTDEVQALCDDFAIFRQQMQQFRANLRASVWGDASPAPVVPPEAPRRARRVRPKATPPEATAPAPRPAAPTAPPAAADVPIEEAVFDYLHTHSTGARLTEIEAQLGINRFQAVDALRSLIQKELIVQKDRTYHIQEEAVL